MVSSMSYKSRNLINVFHFVSDSVDLVASVLTGSKPVILVVMHHTFNPHSVVSESKRQVNNPNVHLTVDCLFYEDKLLNCKLNDNIENTLFKLFKLSVYQVMISRTDLVLHIYTMTEVCGVIFLKISDNDFLSFSFSFFLFFRWFCGVSMTVLMLCYAIFLNWWKPSGSNFTSHIMLFQWTFWTLSF